MASRESPGPPPVDEAVTVVSHRAVAPGHWAIRLRAPSIARSARPGQFVMVRVGERNDPLLRRPMSVGGVVPADGTIELLYRVSGTGTGLLATRHPGDVLTVLGPLGRPYVLPSEGTVYLVGGGIGMPPMYFAAACLPADRTVVIQGARMDGLILYRDEFAALGVRHRWTTEDGSSGLRGLITDAVGEELDRAAGERAEILACGPMPMLAAVAHLASARGIPCQVSVEERMACGIGICMGCATPLARSTPEKPEYALVCVDGPVFAGTEVF